MCASQYASASLYSLRTLSVQYLAISPCAAPPQRCGIGEKARALAWASSFFGAARFGRWVVTHASADSNLHGHRPAIL